MHAGWLFRLPAHGEDNRETALAGRYPRQSVTKRRLARRTTGSATGMTIGAGHGGHQPATSGCVRLRSTAARASSGPGYTVPSTSSPPSLRQTQAAGMSRIPERRLRAYT